LPKEGSHHDLPIALGLMAAIGAISTWTPSRASPCSELGNKTLGFSPISEPGFLFTPFKETIQRQVQMFLFRVNYRFTGLFTH
jgi:hypothetical protein